MSVLYCEFCGEYVDLDYNDEHYFPDGSCWKELADKVESKGLSDEEFDKELESLYEGCFDKTDK